MNMKKEKIRDGVVGIVFAIMSLIFLLLVSSKISAHPLHENHDEEIINKSKNKKKSTYVKNFHDSET